MTVVEARRLTRRFGDFTAVSDLHLDLHTGEVVGLLGANGAGKTTVLKMLLGLLLPSTGQISLFGERQSAEQRRRIGYVPQNLGLYPDLTGAENLEFRANVFGARIPAGSGSGASDHRLVGHLPIGRQREIAFRAAIQHVPDLLILDEPTSGVSPLARSELWDLIRSEADRGAAVLVSTHYMDEAVQADRLIVMTRGRVVAAGSVDEIIGDRRTMVVEADHWHDAFGLLDHAGYTVVLAGRRLRVPLHDPGELRALTDHFAAAGVDADIRVEPATLDETIVELSA